MLKHFRVPGRLALKLTELDISIPAVLRRAGLPRDLFDQMRILVSTSELFALWRAIESVSSDPLIGLKLGVETKTERFHPMAIAALSTQNFVAAVEHMARYKKLTAPEEILPQLDGAGFSIAFRWLLAVDAEPQVLTDYCFAWMLTIARHGTGTQFNPVRVEHVQQRATCGRLSGISAARLLAAPHTTRSFFAPPTPPHPSLPAMPNCSIYWHRSLKSSCGNTRRRIISLNSCAEPFRID